MKLTRIESRAEQTNREAMSTIEAERQAIDEKSARLRDQRLARIAKDAEEEPPTVSERVVEKATKIVRGLRE